MEHSLLFLLTVMFATVHCAHLPFEKLTFPTISDTMFCESILSPNEKALKKSLEASFVNNVKSDTRLDEIDHLDLCCRSFYKCNSYKNIEFNYTNERNIGHCDCEYFFRACLNNLNTTLSNEIGFIHIVNTTKCYANDYPIVKCIKFDTFSESNDQFPQLSNSTEREKFSSRCFKYKLDESKTKRVQLFDLSFHGIAPSAMDGTVLLISYFFFVETISCSIFLNFLSK